jgi:Protein of unknown function (DUF3551)
MRRFLAVMLSSAFVGLASVVPAAAEVTYPWCARYAEQPRTCSLTDPAQCRVVVSGTLNCGFVSLDQCRAALSGNGGSCEVNPLYTPRVR